MATCLGSRCVLGMIQCTEQQSACANTQLCHVHMLGAELEAEALGVECPVHERVSWHHCASDGCALEADA